jgi:hydroxymethylpyrimidine/phosphomethylpyrimidine kinase
VWQKVCELTSFGFVEFIMKTALTIAGSDSGGGAGIQADLKTFAARGVFGTSAITAITAQNTRGVMRVLELPPDLVAAQVDAVLSDIGADAVKTGMLGSVTIIENVAQKLREWKIENLVVDPVMVAKSGDKLLRDDAVESVKNAMLPLALVLTPNRYEAGILCGFAVESVDDAKRAAAEIIRLGARNVVVKGLRRDDQIVDIFFDGDAFIEYSNRYVATRNMQGTGCTFSAAIAAELAKGCVVKDAIPIAREYLQRALEQAPNLGGGHGPLQHFPN